MLVITDCALDGFSTPKIRSTESHNFSSFSPDVSGHRLCFGRLPLCFSTPTICSTESHNFSSSFSSFSHHSLPFPKLAWGQVVLQPFLQQQERLLVLASELSLLTTELWGRGCLHFPEAFAHSGDIPSSAVCLPETMREPKEFCRHCQVHLHQRLHRSAPSDTCSLDGTRLRAKASSLSKGGKES